MEEGRRNWEVASAAPPMLKQVSRELGMEVNIENKEFVAYTPFHHVSIGKEHLIEFFNSNRATAIAKKVGKEFIFGVSVCTEGDNFNRKEGRKLAKERLDLGTWRMDATNYRRMRETWEQAIIRFVHELVEKAQEKPNKFKRKICKNCKSEETNGKVAN